jgi:invasion protein IalB
MSGGKSFLQEEVTMSFPHPASAPRPAGARKALAGSRAIEAALLAAVLAIGAVPVGVIGATQVAAQAAQPAQPRPAQRQPAQQPAQQQPAQAPAQGSGPTLVQVKAEPTQPEWVKVCGRDPSNNQEICYTTRDFVSDQGQPVMAVAVYDIKGQPQKLVRFLLPIGLLLQPGIRMGVDQGQPIAGRFQICFPNGCFAEVTATDATVTALKRGTNINVSVQNQAAREVTFQVPLDGFAKGFDGPPIDPKVLEEQQRKMQDEMQRRSDDMRRKLEGAAGSAIVPTTPPGGAPATAPKP